MKVDHEVVAEVVAEVVEEDAAGVTFMVAMEMIITAETAVKPLQTLAMSKNFLHCLEELPYLSLHLKFI